MTRVPDVVELCRELVRIPSVGEIHGEAAVIAALAGHVDGPPGLRHEVVEPAPGRPSLICTIDAAEPGPTLLLNGHVDTVSPASGWTVDPFAAAREGDRVRGLGTSDMKGGVAALVATLLAVVADGGPAAGSLVLAATADEDAGMEWGVPWLLDHGYLRADAAIVAEAAGEDADFDRLLLTSRGYAYVDVEVRCGGRAHASRYDPAQPHAVAIASALLLAIEREFVPSPASHPRFPDGPTVVAGHQFAGGEALGRLAEHATFSVGARLLPGAASAVDLGARFVSELRAFAAARAPGCDVTVTPVAGSPFAAGMDLPATHPLASAAADAVARAGYPRPRTGGMSGFSEGAFLAARGIPTLPALGPGRFALAHGPDEWVGVDALRRAVAIYRDVIDQLLRRDSPLGAAA